MDWHSFFLIVIAAYAVVMTALFAIFVLFPHKTIGPDPDVLGDTTGYDRAPSNRRF